MADPVMFEFLHAEIVKHIMEEKDEKTGKVKIFSLLSSFVIFMSKTGAWKINFS